MTNQNNNNFNKQIIESDMQRVAPIKVAAIDFIPAWGDLSGNITRLVAAVEQVAKEDVDYAVFPETALCGYLFSDYEEIYPYLDTIPGKTTEAILPLLKTYNLYISIGIAELDVATGVAYNSAVLMGPEGIIGKYRKIGLNSQDQKLFAPGNCDVEVFDTLIGRIGLLICYDDTYWQYPRIAMLKGAQIIGWHSVSDRVMPTASPIEKLGDHSTVAHVQHLSAMNGVWAVCATRSGIERNPLNKEALYYNGGSSIWSPEGHKVTQAPVIPPVEITPGLNGIYTAIIDLKDADNARTAILKRRRPELYRPLLALHRAPTDSNRSALWKNPAQITMISAQWQPQDKLQDLVDRDEISVGKDQLLVLPEFSAIALSESQGDILEASDHPNGLFEQQLMAIAGKGQGYVVGSYPEIEEDHLYHTIVLAGPEGTILARHRVTHLNERDQGWAKAGHRPTVVETAVGRIALAASYELGIVDFSGLYSALRADIVAVPSGTPSGLKVEADARLYAVSPAPTGIAEYYPYATATLQQLWVVCGGREVGAFTSSGIYGPEPIVLTPTLLAAPGDKRIALESRVPAPFTWINQERLIHGQEAIWFPPLVSDQFNQH